MSDDLQLRGLLRGFMARLPLCNLGEARVLDVALTTLEQIRGGGDRQWQRRIATGPGDVDRSWHLTKPRRPPFQPQPDPWADGVVTACSGSWDLTDAAETSLNPPIDERCHACWRAACGGSAIGMALLEVAGQLAIQDRDRAELREAARDEMFSAPVAVPDAVARAGAAAVVRDVPIGQPGDDMSEPVVVDEFELDQRTRVTSDSAVIALCEQPRERDPDREVDLQFDTSDADQPIGVQVPGAGAAGGAEPG